MEWLKLNDQGEVEFVAEEIKLVPEIQTLLALKYNKGKGDMDGRRRTRAINELKYLYLVYSTRSPYRDYSDSEKEQEARRDCNFGNDWSESTELKLLIPKFIKGTQSKVARLLQTTEKFLDKFESYLNDINLKEKKEDGTYIHKPKEIIDALKQLPSLAATLQELEQQVKIGVVGNPKSKGDHEIGWMEGNGTTKKEDDE